MKLNEIEDKKKKKKKSCRGKIRNKQNKMDRQRGQQDNFPLQIINYFPIGHRKRKKDSEYFRGCLGVTGEGLVCFCGVERVMCFHSEHYIPFPHTQDELHHKIYKKFYTAIKLIFIH